MSSRRVACLDSISCSRRLRSDVTSAFWIGTSILRSVYREKNLSVGDFKSYLREKFNVNELDHIHLFVNN